MNYPLDASYTGLKEYVYKLRLALQDTDPAVTAEAWYELHRIEGILQYMKSELERDKE
jgi:hypothetical protein